MAAEDIGEWCSWEWVGFVGIVYGLEDIGCKFAECGDVVVG